MSSLLIGAGIKELIKQLKQLTDKEETKIDIVSDISDKQKAASESLSEETVNDRLLRILRAKSKSGAESPVGTLNNKLNNMILNADSVSPLMRQIIEIIQHSYTNPDSRPEQITLEGETLDYKPSLSTGLYAHYENDKTLILSIHGADDLRLNRLAISQFINPNLLDDDIQEFCAKYSQVRRVAKDVFLFGHSLAYWLTASCREFSGDMNVKGMFIGGYTPNSTSPQSISIASAARVKKLLFENDFLANKTLETPAPRNVLVFRPYDTFSRLNGHSINTYRKPPQILNAARVRYLP